MARNVFWCLSSWQADMDRPTPTLLLVGDSWFWYPFDKLAVEIGVRLQQQVLLVVGLNGAEAAEWATKYRKDIERWFDWFAAGARGLLLSGIEGVYRAVTEKFHAYNPSAPVFVHQYENAWPTGQGVFGPGDWLKEPMDSASVPEALRRRLFKDLIQRLREMQLGLAQVPALRVVVIDSAGTLPEDKSMWANELHPTPAGFRRLARKAVLPALAGEGIA